MITMSKLVVAAALALGALVLPSAGASAMPIDTSPAITASAATGEAVVEKAHWRGGWHRQHRWHRAYGWHRHYGYYRPYGFRPHYGWRRPYGWHHRPHYGWRHHGWNRPHYGFRHHWR